MFLQWKKIAPRSSPRKRLQPLHRTSPRQRIAFENCEDSGAPPLWHWDKRRRSERNNDVCLLSDDVPMKVASCDENNAVCSNKKQLPTLTPEMEAVTDSALTHKSTSDVLCEGFNISLTCGDLKVLHGDEWLSDQIISFYMSLIVERSKRRRFPRIFAFDTFFFTKLFSGHHAAVKRWTKKVDLFSFDIVLIPVHKRKGHWCLAIIDFRSRKILYYDPMKMTYYACLYTLRDYLKDESIDKKNTVFDMSSWKYEHVKNVSIQESDSDCGVFVLKYAEYYCRDAVIDFSQEDVQHFRKCMVYELLSKKLL